LLTGKQKPLKTVWRTTVPFTCAKAISLTMARRGGKRRRSKSRDREDNSSFTVAGRDGERLENSSSFPSIQTIFVPAAVGKKDGDKFSSLSHRSFPAPISIQERMEDKNIKDLLLLWETYLENTQKNRKNHSIEQCKKFTPSPIQQHLWSILLKTSWNAIGIAPTSSGKTLSYAIPTLVCGCSNNGQVSSVVVLVPTKELVQQVASVYQKLIKILNDMCRNMTSATNELKMISRVVIPIYGGVNRQEQVQTIMDARRTGRPMVIVATPGRFLDILEQQEKQDPAKQSCSGGTCRDFVFEAGGSHWIVLDEADQLTKEGDLGPQVHNILTRLTKTKLDSPSNPVRLVFVSATMSSNARKKFEEWMNSDYALLAPFDIAVTSTRVDGTTNDGAMKEFVPGVSQPNKVNVSNQNSLFSAIPCHLKQVVHVCSEHKKPRKLVHVLQMIQKGQDPVGNAKKGIVFFSKIEKLDYSCKLLTRQGIRCFPLHGQLSTTIRQKHLYSFASTKRARESESPLMLLLATDVAARGIDIPGIDFVIQYDFPGNLEQYIHRCGRAGRSRAGAISDPVASDSISQSKEFAVYAFFTRNLQRMAEDLVRLLETHAAWVDPNLRALVQSSTSAIPGKESSEEENPCHASDSNTTKRRSSRNNSTKQAMKDMDGTIDSDAAALSEDEFAFLSANRIVLKRASHVSDASSDDDSSCKNEERRN
jgi:superfamily II DNA/RNA helicase